MGLRLETQVSADEVLTTLNEAQTVVIPQEMGNAVEEIMDESVAQLQIYPSETAGNQPPPPYYRRGTGMIGWGDRPVAGKESELLNANWQIEVNPSADGVVGIIRNPVSYSGYVHDASPETPQVPWHAAAGWPIAVDLVRGVVTGQDEATEVSSEAIETSGPFSRALQRIANHFNK